MKTLEITQAEYLVFRRLQVKKRWDWPATFSTNSHGEIWPYVTCGRTPVEDRTDVRGLSDLLDQVADIYTGRREEGGRFFIGSKGAFWPAKDGTPQPMVHWDFGEETPTPVPTKTFAKYLEDAIPRRR